LVVHRDIEQVDVSPDCVNEMISADAETVSVTTCYHYVQLVVCHLYTRGNGQRAAMKRVHAISIDEAGQVGGTADPADCHDVVGLDVHFGENFLKRRQNAEVAAARAPVGIDLSFEIRRCECWWFQYGRH
jgi:hypothetical protein